MKLNDRRMTSTPHSRPIRRHVLTPDALEMVDTIARTGSFAAAARELGKVPSALTYSVRQLEDALDVLLFDRSSRQARLTPAGNELLHEGRRLLAQMDAVANRVQRVASGWETQLTLAVDTALCQLPLFDLMDAFYAQSPPTRLKVQHEVLNGTLEALASGKADLALGLGSGGLGTSDVRTEVLGTLPFDFVVAPHHPLAQLHQADPAQAQPGVQPLSNEALIAHRIVAVADTAHRFDRVTVGILPGQDVLTVSTMSDKLEAIRRGLGCGSVPRHLAMQGLSAGTLVAIPLAQPGRAVTMHYGWRQTGQQPGKALAWWLQHLQSAKTRLALLGQSAS
jgi:DNA-binding transcriptional LysR family regulator